MNIIIKETNAPETLSIIDPKTGVDYITDFIGNTGALDRDFEWDDDRGAYVCSQETYDWWEQVVSDNQALEDRIHTLAQEHGLDAVYEAIADAGYVDLEDHAVNVAQVLDEVFGQE